MATKSKTPALNRAIFSQQSFDSGSLTPLASLFHRFDEEGAYEAFVHRRRAVVARIPIEVSKEFAERQISVDLASLAGDDPNCCCDEESAYKLALHGVVGFYVSKGVGGFNIKLRKTDDEKESKKTLFDNATKVPDGDLFVVTLVRPGEYELLETKSKAKASAKVSLPKGQKSFRPDKPTLIQLENGKFSSSELQIFSGQSIVIQSSGAKRIQVTLAKPEDVGEPTGRGKISRQRPKPRKPKP